MLLQPVPDKELPWAVPLEIHSVMACDAADILHPVVYQHIQASSTAACDLPGSASDLPGKHLAPIDAAQSWQQVTPQTCMIPACVTLALATVHTASCAQQSTIVTPHCG